MPTVPKVALALLALAWPAFADEVVLNNGSTFTGVVREEYGRVILEVEGGTMTFDRAHVRSVRKGEDLVREFEERRRGATDAQKTYELAVWARGKGLQDRANALFRKVIELDPDHADARKALGYERVHGSWLKGDDLMTAKGFIKYNGQWLSQETVLRLREQDLALTIERERIASNERIVKLQADLERSRIATERMRIELARHDPGNCTDSDHGWSARFSCRPAASLVSPPPPRPVILLPDRGCRTAPGVPSAGCACGKGAWCTCPSFRSQGWTFLGSGGGPAVLRR
jgi:hypothetical protein